MKLAKEIVEELREGRAKHLFNTGMEEEAIIAAKLEPVRKAMSGAGKIAQAFGPEGYACRAFIKDALALLEDEG